MSSFRIFQETRDRLYKVLNQLARVAEERRETTITDITDVGIDTSFYENLNTNQDINRRFLADILRERAENVRKKRAFRLAVVGEFNVGKSTLINALLRKKVLSDGRQPTTATITTLRYGESEQFRVTYLPQYQTQHPTILQNSTDLFNDIAKYTSDPAQCNDNGQAILTGKEVSLAEKIKEVEVWCNADFLREQEIEIEIIDTPGLGSIYEAHKTVTYSLIPEVDATLFLISSDGVGEEHISFLKFLREYVNQMLFVMTKIDYARDKEELEDKLSFNRKAIMASVEKINIQKIYPVSAITVLHGNDSESGFAEFKQALEHFLIKSSGTARLQIPLQVAELNWKLLQQSVERDIELANKSLKKVQEEKEELDRQKQHINQRKQDLMRYIHDTIKDMHEDATHGIDLLNTQIQMAVERQVDSYNLKELFQVDKRVPVIIKGKIDEWITEKEKRFQNKAQLLYRRIEEDLRVILETIQSTTSSDNQNERTDIVTPQVKGAFTKGVLKFTQSAAVNTGISFSTGLTLSALIFSIGTAPMLDFILASNVVMVAAPILVLIPLLLTARTVVQETFLFKKKLCTNIKDAMVKNIPHNSVNVYQAVVEGYMDDKGNRQLGMRQILTESFNGWGNQLKENVELIVTNNIDRYTQSLDKRIWDEERGGWNREANIKTYNQQNEALLKTEKQLIELKTIIEKLSVDDINDGSESDEI
ncbi:MAG: dynamin family protein [Calothrix sp. FI2-JRJ7]|jgi:ribosome biogenesis GTPase A|nr:dynamin family protein [Calothrix sp. FI2-JRJ7]